MNTVSLLIGFAILLGVAVGVLIWVLRKPAATDTQKQEEMWRELQTLSAQVASLQTEKKNLEEERTRLKEEHYSKSPPSFVLSSWCISCLLCRTKGLQMHQRFSLAFMSQHIFSAFLVQKADRLFQNPRLQAKM